MRYLVFILPLFLLATSSCKSTKKFRAQKKTASMDWVNPVIEPVSHPGITEVFEEYSDQEENGINKHGLVDFCNRMNKLFSDSHLTNTEADSVYIYLYQTGQLFNEPTGMPDPEEIRPRETLEKFKSRVAIRKNENKSYSIFFVKTGCGYTFFFGHFTISQDVKRIELQTEEVWRASMPC